MKLGKSVLVEIVAILQVGLTEGKDISQMLRDIDLDVDLEKQVVELSEGYLKSRGRG